jgi:hypothetical protein
MAKNDTNNTIKVTSLVGDDVETAVVEKALPKEPEVSSAVISENSNRDEDSGKQEPTKVAPSQVVKVVSDVAPEMILIATESCSPTIGKYRLNLVKDRKFKVPAWVGEDLLRSKVAVKA